MRHLHARIGGATLAVLLAAGTAPGVDPDLLGVLPADHLAFIAVQPTAAPSPEANQHPSFVEFAGRFVRQLSDLAGVDQAHSTGIVADVLTTLGLLADYPYFVVVTDARARSTGPNRFKLAELQAALVIKTDADNGCVIRQLQSLLSAYTQSDRARIERRVDDNVTVHTLVDERAPDWARVSWAAVDAFYIVALGDTAFQASLSAARGSPRTNWPAWLNDALSATAASKASLLWGFHPKPAYHALGAEIRPTVKQVLTSLALDGADHAIWSVRRENRAVLATVAYDVQNDIQRVEITRPALSAVEKQAIPDQATSYAVIQFPVAEAIERTVHAYLNSRRPEYRQTLSDAWDAAAREAGLDLQGALYAQLGDRIIIHDYPPHPLRIPLLVTVLAEIRGSADSVDLALATVFTQADRWLGSDAERNFLSPQMVQQSDGVWTLRIGMDGPSLGVGRRWMVLGHSPVAVRTTLQALDPPATPSAERSAGPTPADAPPGGRNASDKAP